MSQKHRNRLRQNSESDDRESDDASVLCRARQMTEQTIQDRPLIATLAVFGVGLGLGVMVGSLLAESPRLRRQTVDSRLHRLFNTMSQALPESIQQRFAG